MFFLLCLGIPSVHFTWGISQAWTFSKPRFRLSGTWRCAKLCGAITEKSIMLLATAVRISELLWTKVYIRVALLSWRSLFGCHFHPFLCYCSSALLVVIEGAKQQVWPLYKVCPREVPLCGLTSHGQLENWKFPFVEQLFGQRWRYVTSCCALPIDQKIGLFLTVTFRWLGTQRQSNCEENGR